MSRTEYYSEEGHGPHEYLELGNFALESGLTLPNAKLAFKTQGTLNKAKDNVILFPHMWSGTSKSMEIFIGKDRPINPDKHFVILPGQFANGFSSSPSNTPPPFNGGAFPNVTIGDDVCAQHRLITEHFGIKRLELVLGWSMGAEQTYEWAVRFPDMVKRALPLPALPRRRHTTTSSCGRMRTPSNRTLPGIMVSTNTRAMFMSGFDAMPRSGR